MSDQPFEISTHTKLVYTAEALALADASPRRLDVPQAKFAARAMVGRPVSIVALPPDMVAAGIEATAIWYRHKPYIALADTEAVDDLLLAHEVGHLCADLEIGTGHGPRWLSAYAAALVEMDRRPVATDLHRVLSPVVARQPLSDRRAAALSSMRRV